MITPDEAEALATTAMQEYIIACECNSREDIANVLMKLVSVCAVGMAAAVGRDEAADRLIGTANFIATTMQAKPWTMEKMQ